VKHAARLLVVFLLAVSCACARGDFATVTIKYQVLVAEQRS
jgi:hypothetical protein